MTSGEWRLAERLEQKLDDGYLLWYDVPLGPRNAHPDFCLIPRPATARKEGHDWGDMTILCAYSKTTDREQLEQLGSDSN